jgi:hypothetical protein
MKITSTLGYSTQQNYHSEEESKQNTRGQGASNHRRKDKHSESSLDSTVHNQILKQQQKKP